MSDFSPIGVLDDKGFVRLVKYSAEDADVVQAARVSYGKGTKTPEEDAKLISYLLLHDHGTPLEHTYFKFHVKCPIFVMRQWVRHRIGQSFNEVSGRYTEMKDEFYTPKVWRAQDLKNKQGSVASELNHSLAFLIADENNIESMRRYHKLLDLGVAREMARMVLPINLYTEFYWTCNARSLISFVTLRSESHAQWEIRAYSDIIFRIFRECMPWTAEAFLSKLDPARYQGLGVVA